MPDDHIVVARDGVNLAVRDHGGDGRPVVLMHGAGANLLSLEHLANALSAYRVVTMDQRWSGQSGDSPLYRWEDLVADVESVLEALEMGNAAVGGHSWGGMIAAHYGAMHPEAPAVFNIDGHGPGDPSLYDGADPVEVEALSEGLATPPRWMGREGDSLWKAQALLKAREAHLAFGIPEDEVDAFAERQFLALSGDLWKHHPSPAMYEGLTGDLGLLSVYRRVEGPFLILVSAGSDWGPEAAKELMAAYRRGLLRALQEISADYPNVRITEFTESGHVELTSARHAPAVGEVIGDFLRSVGYPA